MEESRKISLERAEELKKEICGFMEFKKTYPLATDPVMTEREDRQKQQIMAYLNASNEQWEDWRWQLQNRISDAGVLSQFMHFSSEDEEMIREISEKYRWATTPYYLSLMDFENQEYAINRMAIPTSRERDTQGELDPMDEEHTNPAACITRRYPNRLIINVTSACAMFCRHCQRRRLIGECDSTKSRAQVDEAIAYVRENEEIRDVLITGGDPMMLSDEFLEYVVKGLRACSNVEIIRIGTRVPVTMPQRITEEFCSMLKKYHPIYMNIQFNHPRELTRDAVKACTRLADAGIPLGNQMVFLKGINDDRYIVQMLNENLLRARVKPYYIFHPKQVVGTRHFQMTVEEGLSIMKYLRGHTSGMAIPQYILNAPHGLGKIPLLYNYILESDEEHVKLETWEGKTAEISYFPR
ncbi:KamA family radical SAM protein [bacterium C-53]|nr:KamA family radical SAM protein [Lachnospiraceae bacterium]NBI02540.1 KamA family radical SAM protein [Lachnospiraceae bacterium]RKJ11628.1 KamA family radical SAM protein [bacterium C-53]